LIVDIKETKMTESTFKTFEVQAAEFARKQVEDGKWNWEKAFDFVQDAVNVRAKSRGAEFEARTHQVENVGWDG